MKKALLYLAPAFIFICFLGLMAMMIPDTVSAQTTNSAICCMNGQLSRTTSNDCQTKGRHVFTNDRDAQKSCPLMVKCYCCDNGSVHADNAGDIQNKGQPLLQNERRGGKPL